MNEPLDKFWAKNKHKRTNHLLCYVTGDTLNNCTLVSI